MPSPLISVVVCTYNRADLLGDVLQTLCDQNLAKSLYDVIIVDNNSTDATKSISEQFITDHENIHYYLELNQGLSHARNRGWRESKAEYVAYIDDDCKTPRQWLQTATTLINRLSPAAFGGAFYPFYASPKPIWFKDSYGAHQPYDKPTVMDAKKCINIFGGNMFFRRSILEAMGGFDPKFGMCGNKVAYGEETVLLIRIATEVPKELLYFDPDLYLYHLVAPQKMTLRWVVKSRFANGRQAFFFPSAQILRSRISMSRFKVVLSVFKLFRIMLVDSLRGFFKRDHEKYPFMANYLKESTLQKFYDLGFLYEHFRSASKVG